MNTSHMTAKFAQHITKKKKYEFIYAQLDYIMSLLQCEAELGHNYLEVSCRKVTTDMIRELKRLGYKIEKGISFVPIIHIKDYTYIISWEE